MKQKLSFLALIFIYLQTYFSWGQLKKTIIN